MSDDRKPDSGPIWNVRSLVGDLADDLPKAAPAPPMRVPAAPPATLSTPARRVLERPDDSNETPPGPISDDALETAESPDPQPRGGWISEGETPRPSSGDSMRLFTLLLGIAVVASVLILIVVGLVAGRDEDLSGAVPPPIPVTSTEDLRDAETPSEVVSHQEEQALPAAVADPEEEALARLEELHRQDLHTVPLDGQYAAQLASKTVGIVDTNQVAANGSHTFYARDILEEHASLRQRFGGEARIVLLLSTDYGRKQQLDGQPLWVTFALLPNSKKEAVTGWCARQFPQMRGAALENRCIPRRLNPPGTSTG
ncbi:hypothetical protein J3R08_003199 [Micromonospora sp. HB375]|uniref:hypothetical protein n=1 Tax=unclassified Micromonospora TaxID=2617518 RepID=UPI001AEB2266|nr:MULTISPECIES: hypothetical protein [unclassified Micromonospora]MBP1783349.1 hypothetical protein [Micromonospora sp. HB375]MDH6468998.1 hypothetical protein [Micromonospora sp. H404/HB375]